MDNTELKVWPVPQRREFIAKATKESEGHHEIDFQGTLKDLEIHRVPLDLPVYRLANGRTIAYQAEVMANEQLPEDFFESDPDSIEAVATQHKILSKLVNKEGLYTHFKNTNNKQTVPLILTEEGYVVNGNRRLCAFRMLYKDDPVAYAHFKNLRVVFLPAAVESDILELEGKLQREEDLKSEYFWVSDALLFRKRKMERWDEKKIASVYRVSSEKVVSERIEMIGLVDDYLKSRNIPQAYSRIEGEEFAFKQLNKFRKRAAKEAWPEYKLDIFNEAVLALIDTPDPTGRKYGQIKTIFGNMDPMIKRIESESTMKKADEAASSEMDDLEVLLGESNSNTSNLSRTVALPQNRKQFTEVVLDFIESEAKLKEKFLRENKLISCLESCLDSLKEAQEALDEPSRTDGAQKLLDDIVSEAGAIQEKLLTADAND
jgi:hypothetical protein